MTAVTAETLRAQYEKETGKRWWVNPVSHGETAYASWEYQEWFESRLIQSQEGERERLRHLVGAISGAYNEAFRDGCDATGAWDCAMEAADEFIKSFLASQSKGEK